MPKNSFLSLSIFCFFVPLLFFFNSGGVLIKHVNGQEVPDGQRVWCIPKPSSTEIALKENVMYACGMVDCSLIQRGGSCFEPNTSMNHASVVMNLYYQQSGRNPWNCDFKGSGIIAIKNPSYGNCNLIGM